MARSTGDFLKMINFQQTIGLGLALMAGLLVVISEARSFSEDQSISAVIPSPNQEFGDDDIVRKSSTSAAAATTSQTGGFALAASNEATVPVYVSPFARTERAERLPYLNFERSESSHAPLNYAPKPMQAAAKDLKTSASYGHHHGHGYDHGHGHGHGYDHSGWLDMGAWTGGKGSFGWYADYPVGKGHYGYGRK